MEKFRPEETVADRLAIGTKQLDLTGEMSQAKTFEQALRDELVHIWSDLAAAYRASRADPREASMGCENLINRIHTITALVGPVSADQVEMPFLLTGMYEQVHREAGIVVTVSEETLQRARDYLAESTRRVGA